MKFYSEVTKNLYDSAEEATKAEQKAQEQKAKEEADRKIKSEQRAARAKEVEEAYNDLQKAHDRYIKLRNKFIDSYGSFHMTYTSRFPSLLDVFDDFDI